MAISSEDLITFLAVLDQGSFSAAARSLGRVPSAVSMSIGLMEAELGLKLFDRSGREAKPTASALSLAPKARQAVSQLLLFETHALSLTQGLETRLTLVVVPELQSLNWSRALAGLSDQYPSLMIDVLSRPQDSALAMLHNRKADLAILFERPRIDERELFAELGSETFIGVIAPGHTALSDEGGSIKSEDLFATRQIVVGGREGAADSRFVLAHDVWYTDSHLAALNMVRESLGWAYLPQSLVQTQLDGQTLIKMTSPDFSNEIRLWVDVAWLKHVPLGLGAARFIELLRLQWPREASSSPDGRCPPPPFAKDNL